VRKEHERMVAAMIEFLRLRAGPSK